MYAIIEDSGTQIKVSEGDVITVDRRDLTGDASSIDFDRVLLIGGGDEDPKIGRPLVPQALVTADVLESGRTPKVDVIKFKRRKGYKRHKGHRQAFLTVKVTKITG